MTPSLLMFLFHLSADNLFFTLVSLFFCSLFCLCSSLSFSFAFQVLFFYSLCSPVFSSLCFFKYLPIFCFFSFCLLPLYFLLNCFYSPSNYYFYCCYNKEHPIPQLLTKQHYIGHCLVLKLQTTETVPEIIVVSYYGCI